MKTKKIGNVKLTYLKKDLRIYKDHAESELLKIFSDKNADELRFEMLDKDIGWAMYYHLAPERANVISWYEFKNNARILEVGAGCGSITEGLVSNKSVSIVANDISEERCLVNAHRNKRSKNLEIVVGNLEEYKPNEKFDYVVCIGVLEYAGTFISGDDPYKKFIEHLKSFLKPDGIVIIAIENKLGFKYFSGAREDHTGKLFDSINNYSGSSLKVRTFGKLELDELVKKSFVNTRFYYPFPDYKLPKLIHTDQYNPTVYGFPYSLLPTPNKDQPRYNLINEKYLMYSLIKNNLYSDHSNSFIVVASNNTIDTSFQYAQFKRINNKIQTTKIISKSVKYVVRDGTKEAPKYVKSVVKSKDILAKNLSMAKVGGVVKNSSGYTRMNFVEGTNAEYLLTNYLIEHNEFKALALIEKYISIVESIKGTKYNPANNNKFKEVFGSSYLSDHENVMSSVDLNIDNFVIDQDEQWHLVDYEWVFDFAIPKELIVTRALYYSLFIRNADVLQDLPSSDNQITIYGGYHLPLIFSSIYKKYLKDSQIKNFLKAEEAFQTFVNNRSTAIKKVEVTELTDIDQLSNRSEQLDPMLKEINILKAENRELKEDIKSIVFSKTYKLSLKIRKIKTIIKP